MKALHFSPVNNGQKPVYNFRTNGVTEEHKSSPAKNTSKVVSTQKESLPEIRDTSSTIKKESRFANFNWEDSLNKAEEKDLVEINLKDAIFGKVDPKTLEQQIGTEQYKKYLDTFDKPYGGLSNLTVDKFI